MDDFIHGYDPAQSRLTLRGISAITPDMVTFMGEKRVRILDASDNTLESLPRNFGDLADLDVALFANNTFTEIPAVLGALPRLRMALFKTNAITTIAEDALPPSLQWLVLTGNRIERLPDAMGRLAHLEKLSLAGNRLRTLPESMQNCRKLGLLRISANAFDTPPPAWLFSMPRLAWYADGGNAFSPPAPASELALVAWDDLVIHTLINESPSSLVYRASLPGGEMVAVKLFKGALTSDGYPLDDMRAFMAAGTHDHLLKIRARITGLPDDRDGLALALVPDDYRQLGKPPSFQSCTRDTYPDGTRFTRDFTFSVLRGIAAAAAHIHARGLQHGDLYAHNILARGDGHALLGDFGAASFCDRHARARESMDIRAFGYLMDDMMTRMDGDAGVLGALRPACLADDPASRPSFAALVPQLLP